MSDTASLAENLGLSGQSVVAVLDSEGVIFKQLTLTMPPEVILQRRVVGSKVDAILIRIEKKVNYKQLFERLKRGLKQGGKICVVTPGRNDADNDTVTNLDEEIIAAAHGSDLEVIKTILLSDEYEGTIFQIRRGKPSL